MNMIKLEFHCGLPNCAILGQRKCILANFITLEFMKNFFLPLTTHIDKGIVLLFVSEQNFLLDQFPIIF